MRARLVLMLVCASLTAAVSSANAENNAVSSTSSIIYRASISSVSPTGEPTTVTLVVESSHARGVAVATDGSGGPIDESEATASISYGASPPACVTDDVVFFDDRTSGDTTIGSTACPFEVTWYETGSTKPVVDQPGVTPGDGSVDTAGGAGISRSATVTGSVGGVPIEPGQPQDASISTKCCVGHVTLMK